MRNRAGRNNIVLRKQHFAGKRGRIMHSQEPYERLAAGLQLPELSRGQFRHRAIPQQIGARLLAFEKSRDTHRRFPQSAASTLLVRDASDFRSWTISCDV